MDKLVEREDAPRGSPLEAAPALAVQFFLIPLAVVAVVLLIYGGFRMLLTDERTAEDYLREISLTRGERRWPAAYELSRLMADSGAQARHVGLGQALLEAFESSKGDDPRVRRYLALAIGRLEQPPPGAVDTLAQGLQDGEPETRISVIWALGALGDPAAIPYVTEAYRSDDAGIRKIAVYALGALGGASGLDTLRLALTDPAPDVQWNAAVALARTGHEEALPVLRRMLDREYVQGVLAAASSDRLRGDDPAAEVLISGLQAASLLKREELRGAVEALSLRDRNLQVRQAALEALDQLGA